MKEPLRLKGVGASWGIAFGKATVIVPKANEIENIQEKDPKKVLQLAKEKTIQLLDTLIGEDNSQKEIAGIVNAHKLMVEGIVDEAFELVKQGESVVNAISLATKKYVELLKSSESALIQSRAEDLEDIKNILLMSLSGYEPKKIGNNANAIVILPDLYPSQVLIYAKMGVRGIVAEKGSYTSHAAIIARALEIPTVLGVPGITQTVRDGDKIIVDGFLGEVIVNPDEKTIGEYLKKKESFEVLKEKFKGIGDEVVSTKDGRKILVTANVGSEDDLNVAVKNGCDGVGLFRLEFYYINRATPPSMEELASLFTKFVKKLGNKPLTIRLLDVGGDKEVPYLQFPKEDNPFLGVRGIRYLLKHPEILEEQVKAILMASKETGGNIRIMAPMISRLEEITKLKEILKELSEDNSANIKLGIMAEVPSVVFMIEKIVKEVDFISIGTNDLTQYIFATDRTNENVSYLYDDMHPAVLRAISEISNKAQKAGVEVDVCGELASNPLAVPILVGLGINELSVSPTRIPLVKWIVKSISYEEAFQLAKEALNSDNGEEVREKARAFFRKKLGVELPF
ncbi:phosphoenolpyruvate--protein phosphotransferase [Thermococcus aggregans]|uniref:Phosphoenolpyruvate-protein phosphotransferase n=1 Tax=Thermococcus aggregans TaxID=110163 RepID=A0A9E7SN60_THEAG|nr:phosphoenolpyruvate--protein phosphotransferase [Thermococcus aggregans]USS40135.1 phosphoenolpyruvate--protein phosphotransferase [Thermococcus aggregans]